MNNSVGTKFTILIISIDANFGERRRRQASELLTKICFDRKDQNRKFGSNRIIMQQFAHVKKYIEDISIAVRCFRLPPRIGDRIR